MAPQHQMVARCHDNRCHVTPRRHKASPCHGNLTPHCTVTSRHDNVRHSMSMLKGVSQRRCQHSWACPQ
ncbi:hypothetical protein FKM82_012418 [Ascaphus truei]